MGALIERVPIGAPLSDPGAILDRFLGWAGEAGLEPWPAQEEALLELLAGKHVVLSTADGLGQVAGGARPCTSRRFCELASAPGTRPPSRRW